MNWFARNLAVVLFGTVTSVLTAMGVILLEARMGMTLFGLTFIRLPLGAIGAGLVGCLGYLAAARALRLWPGVMDVTAILTVAAGVVFLVQSAEFEVFWGGATQAVASTRDTASFLHFLGTSLAQSPLWGSSGDSSDDSASAVFFSGGPSAMSRVSSTGDSRVDGIGEGVGGMMASQDVSNTAAAKHVDQIGAGITAMGAKVRNHSSVWTMMLVQVMGFAAGGLAVFAYLRTLPHCKSCMLLLAKKGAKTRYFSRTREMRSAVDEVLIRAREKQLQQSILMHMAKGSEKKQNWSEFCSVYEIRRCMQCNTHSLSYRARRKVGATWKDIALLAFSASTLEPVDFAQ